MPHERFSEGVFVGRVSHARNLAVAHRFSYRVWMALAQLQDSRLPRLLRPRTSRYLSVSDVLARSGLEALDRRGATVWLLTQPSLLGRSFNPVSFYFVESEGALVSIVAHITNTPWDESHCYVLAQNADNVWQFDKRFHVSPFLPMDIRYRWCFTVEHGHIRVAMRLARGDQPVFAAHLALRRASLRPLTPLWLRARHPLQNLTTLARIYWQALVLKLKGAPFHAHPE